MPGVTSLTPRIALIVGVLAAPTRGKMIGAALRWLTDQDLNALEDDTAADSVR